MTLAAQTTETAKIVPPTEKTVARWGATAPHVKRALAFVRKKGAVTVEELVEWDRTHGRRLFTWDEAEAARLGRIEEARIFLNRFRAQFEGMRVRAFIHVDADPDRDIEESAYYTVETITKHSGMRAQVIEDISRRIARLASELKMWKLSDQERESLIARWREAIQEAA